jgi:hypothetical protein
VSGPEYDRTALVTAFRRGVQLRDTTNAPIPDDDDVLARLAGPDVTAYCANCGLAMCPHASADLIRTSQALRLIRDTCPGTAARIARRGLGDIPDPPEACARCDGSGYYYAELPDSGDTDGTWVRCDCATEGT